MLDGVQVELLDRLRLKPGSRLTLHTGNSVEAIPLDHPLRGDGWWDVERDLYRM
jgi:hypothetical protein